MLSAVLLALSVVALEQVYTRWGCFGSLATTLESTWPKLTCFSQVTRDVYDLYFSVLPDTAKATQVPLSPLFAWLFTVFTVPEPYVGFVLWILLTAIAAVYLARRPTSFFRRRSEAS